MTMKKKQSITEMEIPLYHIELVRDRSIKFKDCHTVVSAAEILHKILDTSPQEKFVVLHMDSHGKMVGAEIIAIGSIEQVNVRMHDIFRGAIVAGVPRIIIAHNHPSGDPRPSPADIVLTTSVVNAGKLIQIEVWDHIVVSPNGEHFSMMDPENYDWVQEQYEIAVSNQFMKMLVDKGLPLISKRP